MANTTNQKVQLYDESGSQIYPKTDATSVMTTNTDTNNTCLDQQQFNNNISDEVTSLAKKLTRNEELCTINGISIKYNSANTLPIGTNTGGDSGSSGSGTSGSSVLDIPLYDSDDYSATVSVTSGKVALVAGDGVTLEKTTKTDSDNGTIPAIKISSSGGGSGDSFGGTTSYPLTIYKGSTGTDCITFNGSTARYLRFGDGLSVEESGLGYIISASGGGSGSISVSGTDSSGGASYFSGTKIRFQITSGISVVSVTKDPKDTTNGVLVNIPYSSSSSSGGTTTSSTVYWSNIQNKPSTLSGYGISSSDTLFDSKYLGASANAASATKLATARTIWGQSFNGTANITGDMTSVGNITFSSQAPVIKWTNSNTQICDGYMDLYATTPYIDFHYNKSSNDYSARLIASADNQLELVTNSGTGTFNFNSNKLKIGNGTLEWDSTNSCFKINGSVYATGGITTLGVSNSSTTTNNVDFTFGSITTSKTATIGTDLTVRGNLTVGKLGYDAENELLSFGNLDIDSNSITTTKGKLSIATASDAVLVLGLYSNIQCEKSVTTISVGSSGSDLHFLANTTTYKLNLSKAIELGVLTT